MGEKRKECPISFKQRIAPKVFHRRVLKTIKNDPETGNKKPQKSKNSIKAIQLTDWVAFICIFEQKNVSLHKFSAQ
jgi:hypothetical protein